MNKLSSYCGLIDTRMRASEKDLPVRYLSDLFYLGILATGSWDASVKVWQCNDMNAYQVNLEHDLLSQLEHENQVRTVGSIVFIKNRSDGSLLK